MLAGNIFIVTGAAATRSLSNAPPVLAGENTFIDNGAAFG